MKFVKKGRRWVNAKGHFIKCADLQTGDFVLSNGDNFGYYSATGENIHLYKGLCVLKQSKGLPVPEAHFAVDLAVVVSYLASDKLYDISRLHSSSSYLVTYVYNENIDELLFLKHPLIVYMDETLQLRETITLSKFTFERTPNKV